MNRVIFIDDHKGDTVGRVVGERSSFVCWVLTGESYPPGVRAPEPCKPEYGGPLAMRCIRFVVNQGLARHPHRWRIVDSLLASNADVSP
jgi:hypothetical protein